MTDNHIPNERRLYEYKSVYTNTDNRKRSKYMAWIPGIFVKGNFKPYCQCTTEELKQAIKEQQIKTLITLGGAGFVIGLALCLLL